MCVALKREFCEVEQVEVEEEEAEGDEGLTS